MSLPCWEFFREQPRPSVTVAAPGTGNPEHMIENLGAARGGLPTEDHRRRMVELVEGLPGG